MADTLVLGTNEVFRAGSSPVARTTSERVTLVPIFYAIKNQSPAPLFLLSAKGHAALHLFACKRAHSGFACYQPFAGF